MILYKNPQFFSQKLHNRIAKLSILVARFLGFTCIQWNSNLDKTNLEDGGRIQGFIVMLLVILCSVSIVVLDRVAVAVVYKYAIDLVLVYLSSMATIILAVIGSIIPVYKKKELIQSYKTAIELGNSILPLKVHPLMDKKFVRKVAMFVIHGILCTINYALIIFYSAIQFDGSFIPLMILRIIFIIPQFLVVMFPLSIILISFTFASHLIKIISLRVRKIVSKIEIMYREKIETQSSDARFMVDCCAMSDDLEYLSECYCKVIEFANHVFQTLEIFMLFYCLQMFLLIISQATSVYSAVFDYSQKANVIQIALFLFSASLLHFFVYGPQKVIKRSKKLQEIVNSLLLEETEPRLDKSVD